MTLRIALLLLLCSASLPLMAREVRQAGPNGDGACPTAAERKAAETGARSGERTAPPAANGERGTAAGGNPESTVRNPRWHSFLPGMFR
ncbi:hypothetical protein QFW77_08650 [Luteimonas sp. RD2P54]|uniref:Secreted protein n=1 Tax=Luteimonas endophytica TaxID=3042023 RepID=A0ABT6J8B7_9GAMM|nr:hypothetical protein [Luteimonas endophytica]MDH5823056.1 hypothetical protein [Luteimonas endophytica]